MMKSRHECTMLVAALWLASFAEAQMSSIKDPFTGEPISFLSRSDSSFAEAQMSSVQDPMTGEPVAFLSRSQMRRRMEGATCPEAIDVEGDSYFHPTQDSDAGVLCTNTRGYPMIWKQIPKANNIPQYISETGQECCEKFYGRHGVPIDRCVVEDVCVDKPVYWHQSKYDSDKCTNSGDYPAAWDQPSIRQYHLFDTAEGCCDNINARSGTNTCDIRDVNEPWSCDKWHLSIETRDGAPVNPDGTCTNSGVVREVWVAYSDHYIFPSHKACCDKFKIDLENCFKVDTCAPPSLPPTPSPTPKPTPAPTTAPTPAPTTAPTPAPTTAPTDPTNDMEQRNDELEVFDCAKASTSVNGAFHPDKYGTLTCTNTNDYPVAWEDLTDVDGNHEFLFDTMEECVDYFTPYIGSNEWVRTVNVCSSECCSYSQEHGLRTDQCQADCNALPDVPTTALPDVPTTTTATTTTSAPISSECEMASPYYHPPKTMKPYCTNSIDYPPEWEDFVDENGNKMFLFDSVDECCQYFTKTGFPRDMCAEVDVCSSDSCCSFAEENGLSLDLCQGGCTTTAATTTAATTTTQTATTTATTTTTATESIPPACEDGSFSVYFHPSMDSIVCTNSPGYPLVWRNLTDPKFLYESAEDCCREYYGRVGIPMDVCEIEDLCPDHKSESVAWDELITTTTTTPPPEQCEDYSFSVYFYPKLGSSDVVCTNAPGYPAVWLNMTAEPKFLHKSGEGCCRDYFGYFGVPMEACEVEDLCPEGKSVSFAIENATSTTTSSTDASDIEQRSDEITSAPTSSPSKSPTAEPTASPTQPPSNSPTSSPTNPPTDSAADQPTDNGMWYPATVNGESTCIYGPDYPEWYANYDWLFDDEQTCCEKEGWNLPCRLKFVVKPDKWFPVIQDGERVCDYGNTYPSSYGDDFLHDSEAACCTKHNLIHCIPREPSWFPQLQEDNTKACVYGVPPLELNSDWLFEERGDCCDVFPEACPQTLSPTATVTRPTIETPPCEESAAGKQCAWWPEIKSVDGKSLLFCQYSSSWPDNAVNTLHPDNDGNGFYECCDKYVCAKNPDGSYMQMMEEFSDEITDAPTPLPSKSPTTAPTTTPTRSPTPLPSKSPTTAPTTAPTGSPTPLPSKSPTTEPTNHPTHSPTDSPTNEPTHSPTAVPTRIPTNHPTHSPSDKPWTSEPTNHPTHSPTGSPTNPPTHSPTDSPTRPPTNPPTHSPTDSPTNPPTHSPTNSPTDNPTNLPTPSPSSSPTKRPSDQPVDEILCAKIWAPVCGEDGNNYGNECEASKVSVNVAYEGECKTPCAPGGECLTEGSSCTRGTETCCGQTYDSLSCNCEKGSWMCTVNDACMQPCSPTSAPTREQTGTPTQPPTPLPTSQPTNLPTQLPTPLPTSQPTPLPSHSPSKSPTSQPVDVTTTTSSTTTTTSGELVTQSSSLCGKFHVSRQASLTCTNSGFGTQDPTSDCAGWYKTGEECCMGYFRRECTVVDVDSPTTTSTTTTTTTTTSTTTTSATALSCGTWHVSREKTNACTNSGFGILAPTSGCNGWYKTGEECCMGYFFGKECTVDDVLEDTTTKPTVSHCEEWHIDEKNPNVCTNSEEGVPPYWRDYYSMFFSSTPEDCCKKVTDCRHVDVCMVCTEEYSPVCGSDNLTYQNRCKAEAAGILVSAGGECEVETTTTTVATKPATTTTTTTPATTTTTTTTPATTTTTPATTTTTATTTTPAATTTTPATTTTTTTTTTPAATTTASTSTSTTFTTTTSNPGDMEQNSDSLNNGDESYDCAQHKRKRQCLRENRSHGCDWDRSDHVCRHQKDEEMEQNSEGVTTEECSAELIEEEALYRRRSKCQKEGCVWTRSKARKERCTAPP